MLCISFYQVSAMQPYLSGLQILRLDHLSEKYLAVVPPDTIICSAVLILLKGLH